MSAPSTTDRNAARLSAALLAGVIGGALGVAGGRLVVGEGSRVAEAQDAQAPAPAPAAAPAALEQQLSALAAAISQLQQSVDRLAHTPPPPSPDTQALLAELVAAVSETTARLRDANTAPLVIPPLDAEMRHRIEALALQDDRLDAQHLFWPAQALLDAYGRPSLVYVNERGEQWQYDLAKPHSITFTLHDGRVIETYSE